MTGLEITPCADDVEWDGFVADSPQGSVFTSSAFLAALGEESIRLFVRESGRPVLAAPILLKSGVPLKQPHAFTQYCGPMFCSTIEQLPAHRRAPLHLRLLDFLLAQLAGCWPLISFSIHPAFNDVRAFQWFNYHQPELGRFVINPAYSGRLDLGGITSQSEYLEQIRAVRRQEFRKVEALGYKLEECADDTALDRLHELTFRRQGIARTANEVRLLHSLATAALKHGFGECLVAHSPDGEAASALLFVHDHDTAYYLFGANDPNLRKYGGGSWLLIQAIERARRAGRQFIDFVGVNSPNRGDFKTSFGALPTPYFNVCWTRP